MKCFQGHRLISFSITVTFTTLSLLLLGAILHTVAMILLFER